MEGIGNCLVKFARCCTPIPGDDIVGFVTRGYGVSVHRRDCVNFKNSSEEDPDRWIDVRWDESNIEAKERFSTALQISTTDRVGVMSDVLMILSNNPVDVRDFNGKTLSEGFAIINAVVDVTGIPSAGDADQQASFSQGCHQRHPSVQIEEGRMRAVLQRVTHAKVSVDGEATGEIGPGFLILLGVAPEDTEKQAQYLAGKCVGLRVFSDEEGRMNRELSDIGGSLLVVSQFTLYGDCRKGKRPNFMGAAKGRAGKPAVQILCGLLP